MQLLRITSKVRQFQIIFRFCQNAFRMTTATHRTGQDNKLKYFHSKRLIARRMYSNNTSKLMVSHVFLALYLSSIFTKHFIFGIPQVVRHRKYGYLFDMELDCQLLKALNVLANWKRFVNVFFHQFTINAIQNINFN